MAAPPLRPSWRSILAIFVALLVAGVAMGQLQGLLLGMHLSDRPAASIGGLNHLFHWGPDTKTASGAVDVWKEYSDATVGQGTADAHEVAWWAVAVDSFLFAPLYALGLFLFLLRARRQLDRWRSEGAPKEVARRLEQGKLVAGGAGEEFHLSLGTYRGLATLGMALIGLGFIADEVENVANISIVRFGWGTDPDYSSGSFHALTWLLWTSGWAKWALDLAAVGLALVLAWVVFAESASTLQTAWRAIRPRLHLLRLQLILVALIAFVPFGHEQIPDLIRRWSPAQLALTAALAWAFALTTWLVARRLLIRGQWPGWSAARRTTLAKILFWSILALAVVQAAAHFLTRHDRYRPGWGLVVPAAVLVALAILGWLLPDEPPEEKGAARGAPIAPEATHPRLPRLLAAFTVVAFGLGVLEASFGYSVYARAWSWKASPLVALGLVLAGALAAALLRREPLLGGGAGALAGLVLLRLVDRGDLPPPVLVGAAVLLVLGGWRLFDALGAVDPPERPISVPVVLGLGVLFALLYAGTIAFPFETGERIGGVGILFFFMIVLTCAGALVVWVNPGLPVPRALSVLRIARFPLVTLIVVWFLAASWIDPGGYHNVRLKNADAPATGVTLEAAWTCWLGKNGLEQNACSSPGTTAKAGGATPLILVATTGGGIRAAYWTGLVLDCAFEVGSTGSCPSGQHSAGFARSDRLFALSGISGGSLGLAEYSAYLAEKRQTGTENGWVQRSLGADALSGSGAWWLFVEIPRVFLQFRSPTDRAGVLERGWERQWPHGELGRGLLELWRTDHHQPLLLLNGTSVEDGCRFETSPLNANVETRNGTPPGCKSTEPFDSSPVDVAARSVLPATRDLVDFLCNDRKDVRLSTAALLSARFPFVNPSARVEGRCHYANAKPPVAYVVDGGYLDTSGASPIVELMPRLQALVDRWNRTHTAGPCVVPAMIQIDNGFAAGASRPPQRPSELLVPLTTLFATRGAREAEARVDAALLFSGVGSTGGDRFAHFVNEAHPGPKAPLGWTESSVSEHELVSQLAREKNEQAFAKVRSWLGGSGLSCPTTP